MGYKCTRQYNSTVNANAKCDYTCEILDGLAHPRPLLSEPRARTSNTQPGKLTCRTDEMRLALAHAVDVLVACRTPAPDRVACHNFSGEACSRGTHTRRTHARMSMRVHMHSHMRTYAGERPLFKITPADDKNFEVSMTASGAWSAIMKRVNANRQKQVAVLDLTIKCLG